MKVDSNLINFFTHNFIPGAIGLVGGKDPLSMAIRLAQVRYTPDGKSSLWSHSFILGDLRRDFNVPSANGRSVYIFESTISVSPAKMNIRNGAQENWIGKWCEEETENAAVIDFGLTESETNAVLAQALQLVCDQIQYPIDDLITIWWHIIFGQEWKPVPADIHALVCTALVRYCYIRARKDFLPVSIPFQNTKPEDIARAAKAAGRMVVYE